MIRLEQKSIMLLWSSVICEPNISLGRWRPWGKQERLLTSGGQHPHCNQSKHLLSLWCTTFCYLKNVYSMSRKARHKPYMMTSEVWTKNKEDNDMNVMPVYSLGTMGQRTMKSNGKHEIDDMPNLPRQSLGREIYLGITAGRCSPISCMRCSIMIEYWEKYCFLSVWRTFTVLWAFMKSREGLWHKFA